MESQTGLQQKLSNQIITFINDFKAMHPKEIEDVFLYGYCYYFAKILEHRFNGEIYYLPIMNHFITKINGDFYDIKGLILYTSEEPYLWENYDEVDVIEYNRIVRDCIRKDKVE